MVRLMPSIVICMVIGCMATLAEIGAAQAVVSFEEPICTNMPVWVHIAFPQSREFIAAQENMRYPFSSTPWDFGLHEFEVTRRDEAMPPLPIKPIFSFIYHSGIAGGS